MDRSYIPVIIEELNKIYYPNKHALDNVNLRIYEGDSVAVLGNNGSGKSTLLRILSTLTPRSSGLVEIFGHDPHTESAQIKRKIGFLPERFSFYPAFTVNEVLTFFEKLYPYLQNNSTDWEDHRENMIKLLKISSYLETKINSLSKGMLHKVGLAVTLIHNPKFLILDEPTSGLDPLIRAQVRKILANLSKDYEKTILMSSHILEDVEAISDSVFILEEGKMIQEISWIKDLTDKFQKLERIEIFSDITEKFVFDPDILDQILFQTNMTNGIEIYCRKRDFDDIKNSLLSIDKDTEINRHNFTLESMYILNHAKIKWID